MLRGDTLSNSNDKFIIRPRKTGYGNTDVISIRIPHELTERLDKAGQESNHSRNQIITMALEYALDRMEIESN